MTGDLADRPGASQAGATPEPGPNPSQADDRAPSEPLGRLAASQAQPQPRKRGRRRNPNWREGEKGNGPKVAPGLLTPTGAVREPATLRAKESLRRAERQKRVYDLFLNSHMTMQQVAEAIGCSNATVCRDLHAAYRANLALAPLAGEQWAKIEMERAERRDRAILPNLYSPNGQLQLKTHERLQASGELRARLSGAFPKPAAADGATYTAEQVLGLMRAVTRDLIEAFMPSDVPLTSEEARQRIAEVFRRRAAIQAIDAPALPARASGQAGDEGQG